MGNPVEEAAERVPPTRVITDADVAQLADWKSAFDASPNAYRPRYPQRWCRRAPWCAATAHGCVDRPQCRQMDGDAESGQRIHRRSPHPAERTHSMRNRCWDGLVSAYS